MQGFHDKDKGIGVVLDDVRLLDGVRTGFGKLAGTIARVSPTDLGITAAKAAMGRAGVEPEAVDQVIFSNLTSSSTDSYYLPRHVGVYSGVPVSVPAILVQRLCATGFETIVSASEQIGLGKASVVLAGSAENMSLSPTVSYGNRMGYGLGQVLFQDFLFEALKDSAVGGHMGCTAENLVRKFGITREEVDAYALRSQQLAIGAKAVLEEEMVPVVPAVFEAAGLLPRKLKLPKRVDAFMADENPRDTSMEKLAKLRPSFEADGLHTAGNSSGIVDGAGAVVVCSGAYADSVGKKGLARVVAATSCGVPPEIMGYGPVPAIRLLLELTGLKLEDIGLIEINEAFSGQYIACERELGLDRDICNVNGGAIALGHPLAVTGIRLSLTLAMEMRRRKVKYGIASACVGGGQGTAVLFENLEV